MPNDQTLVFDHRDDPDQEPAVLDGFVPSERHRALVRDVTRLVEHWQPRLPWLAGWTLRVRAIPPNEAASPIRVAGYAYIQQADIEVRESLLDEARHEAQPRRHSLEEFVLHELSHILFEPMRFVALNHATFTPAVVNSFKDAEEPAAWMLGELLSALARSSPSLLKLEHPQLMPRFDGG